MEGSLGIHQTYLEVLLIHQVLKGYLMLRRNYQ